MRTDSETYWIKEENRYKTTTPKTQIILATSLRKDHNHIIRLQHKDFGKSKRWSTYSISRDGLVYQHYDPKNRADFMGVKEIDKQSISIVLENMGSLFEMPNGKYVNWLNEVCENERVVEKTWLGYKQWEMFSPEQLEACAELCNSLCDEFGIHKRIMDFHHYHKDTQRFKGIVFKSNYLENTSDINPLFDSAEFDKMLVHNENI